MVINSSEFIETNPLTPVGPASQLFIAGAAVFEITDFEPPVQRVTIVGINLPEPDTFGPFDTYVATLIDPDQDVITTLILEPTENQQVWAQTTLLTFGGTLFPIDVSVRPQQLDDERMGPVILEGPVLTADNNASS